MVAVVAAITYSVLKLAKADSDWILIRSGSSEFAKVKQQSSSERLKTDKFGF